MNFSHKQLTYIYTVLATENISRAAEKCFVSQPAMSQTVQEFEKEYDLLIFERIGKKIKITPQGEEVKKELAVLLMALQGFQERLVELSSNQRGKVKIGIPPIILSVYFYDIISKFMMINPSIELEIIELGANRLITELEYGNIELAILIEPFESSICNKRLLTTSNFALVMNQENKLNQKNKIGIKDLEECPLVLLNEDFQLYNVIIDSFKSRNINPDITFTTKQWDLLINMVKHNAQAVSILPMPILEQYSQDQLRIYPIDLDVEWKIILVERKTLNKTISNKSIIDFIINWFK